jgi:hypothetical protein
MDSNNVIQFQTNKPNGGVFPAILFAFALYKVFLTGQYLLAALGVIFFVFAIHRMIKKLGLPFAELNEESLILRPQPMLGEKVIKREDIESVSIDNNFNKTITVQCKNGPDYRCHGWNLKPEDYERFIEALNPPTKG